jgi:hypothetical protein
VRATERTKLTPPELARRWGISPDKVLAWIKSGELRAVNGALKVHGRPRFLIDVADIIAFEQRRMVAISSQACNRKRQPAGVIQYF